MRQIVLVDRPQWIPLRTMLNHIRAADLPDCPVVIYSVSRKSSPFREDGDLVSILTSLGLESDDISADGFVCPTSGNSYLNLRRRSGNFTDPHPDWLEKQISCFDILVIDTPAYAFLDACRTYEHYLFAVIGSSTTLNVQATINYLSGLVDRQRADAWRKRGEQTDAVSAQSEKGYIPVVAGRALIQQANVDDVDDRPEVTIFTTGVELERVVEDARGFGFGFVIERMRIGTNGAVINARDHGIVMYGPYLNLAPGHFRFRLYAAANAVFTRITFVIEATTSSSFAVLARQEYSFDERAEAFLAVLDFEVATAHADEQIEVRLWSQIGSSNFSLLNISLSRLS